MKNKIVLSSILALNLTLNAKEFTLNDLVDIALKNNANIQISKYNKEIKEKELKKTKSSYLPKVNANANIGQYDIKVPSAKQDGSAYSVGLNANQLIYDFGKTSNQIDSSKHNLEISKKDIKLNIKSTILAIKKTYYDILDKHQQIIVVKEALKLDELQLFQAKAYFKAGVRTQIDITNAQLQLSNSKLKLVKAKYALKIAKTQLISLLGKKIDENIQIKTENKSIDILAKEVALKDDSLENLINQALEKRLEIKKLQEIVKVYKSKLKAINAQYYPTLDLSASYKDQKSDDIKNLEQRQMAVLLNIKWDLYTGNTTKLDKKTSLANIHKVLKQVEQQKLEIKQNVTNAYLNLQQSYESIKINILSLDLAIENLNLANERYKAGLNDLLEVNDAKLSFTQAKINLVNAYYIHLKNKANLNYALGL